MYYNNIWEIIFFLVQEMFISLHYSSLAISNSFIHTDPEGE